MGTIDGIDGIDVGLTAELPTFATDPFDVTADIMTGDSSLDINAAPVIDTCGITSQNSGSDVDGDGDTYLEARKLAAKGGVRQSEGRGIQPRQRHDHADRIYRERAGRRQFRPERRSRLRANAGIRLRQGGYTGQQISDMAGMSVEMIERYSRYADRKAGGQAVLRDLQERKQDKTAKRLQSVKQKEW